MKSLACKDLGIECMFVAKADNEEDVIDMTMKHTENEHPMQAADMKTKMTDDERHEMLMEKMKVE